MTRRTIFNVRKPGEFLEARKLFEEYAQDIGIDLGFQNFEDELEALPSIYSPPAGCLLLARDNGLIAGCVGVRLFEAEVCEMKRLYVRPSLRGRAIGRSLVTAIVERARGLGYRRMVLDTLASMTPARQLYRSLGFCETDPYYENPIENAVYMSLDLAGDSSSGGGS